MKSRFSFTLDPEVVRRAQRSARQAKRSLSGVVEDLLADYSSRAREGRRSEPFADRWLGRFEVREDETDERLAALKRKHGLTR